MKKLIVAFLFLSAFSNWAQENPGAKKNFIEITGSSETDIVPDEIYISVLLLERQNGKEKITLEKQESDLKDALKSLNIPVSNLTLSDANADYHKYKFKKGDVVNSRSYLLKLSDTKSLNEIYKKFDELNVEDAYIYKLNHTKLLDFARENRIKAIKAAKEKVDYLLAAVGQKSGSPIIIREVENVIFDRPVGNQNNYFYRGGSMSNMMQSVNYDRPVIPDEADEQITFTKIKLKASYFVMYEIISK